MNVLIISTNRSAHPTPVLPAGACLTAEAAERAGHSVSLLDLMFTADPLRAVKERLRQGAFDVVGLSIRNIDNNDMGSSVCYINEIIPLVAAIRKYSDAVIVLGGASLSVMPREILRALEADCAVTGDGVAVFPRLLDRIARRRPYGDLPGVAFLDAGVFTTNPLPSLYTQCAAPDYERWVRLRAYRSHLSTIPLQTKLGCQFRCVYCTYPKIDGESYRLFDPAGVTEAAIRLTASGLYDIEFVDNIFNAPPGHALDLCESFIASGLRARFQSLELNPAYIDHELLTAMERSGFVGMGITVESAADPVLHGLRKGFAAREVHHAAELIRKHRIPCLWMFLLGGPGETRATVKETLHFAEARIPPRDAVFFNVGIRIYPGTELETIARKEGVLARAPEDMLAPVFYVSPEVDVSWIRAQVRESMSGNMNFMSIDSIGFPYMPLIQRTGYRLGLKTPLWRYTGPIRKGLRLFGINA